jgi:hypothetical protein
MGIDDAISNVEMVANGEMLGINVILWQVGYLIQ